MLVHIGLHQSWACATFLDFAFFWRVVAKRCEELRQRDKSGRNGLQVETSFKSRRTMGRCSLLIKITFDPDP